LRTQMRYRPNFFGNPIERRFPPHADSGKMALLINDWPH
jgi:hypothetical protein